LRKRGRTCGLRQPKCGDSDAQLNTLLAIAQTGLHFTEGEFDKERYPEALVTLTEQRMPAGYSHYLVYPQRSADYPPLLAFRDWLHPEIRKYLSGERGRARAPSGAARTKTAAGSRSP